MAVFTASEMKYSGKIPVYHVVIEKKTFYIIEYKLSKSPDAKKLLEMLSKIETILREDLPYSQLSKDDYAKLGKYDLRDKLGQITKTCLSAFDREVSGLSPYLQKWQGLDKVVPEIKKAEVRIQALLNHSMIFQLPSVLQQMILDKVTLRDVAKFRLTSRSGRAASDLNFIQTACEFGYETKIPLISPDPLAIAHLSGIIREIRVLCENKYFEKQRRCVEATSEQKSEFRWAFVQITFTKIDHSRAILKEFDAEETLRALKSLTLEEFAEIFSSDKIYALPLQYISRYLWKLKQAGHLQLKSGEPSGKFKDIIRLAQQHKLEHLAGVLDLTIIKK